MTSTNTEPAGVFIRVSTAGQDEAQQVPAVEGHCETHGYKITRRYELNDKSASKGEQQAKLDEMLADMRNGTIKVLVCWRSNRLERRGPEALFKLLRQVKDAGGRIESTTEPMLGTEDLSGEALTALGAVMDKQFSAKLSEDTLRAITNIKANGYVFNGNVPWGYEIIGPKYAKSMVPTELCRLYVPQIFARCIKGQSLRQIAAWLDSEGVPTARGGKWNEGSVRWIINTRAYAGRWVIPERKKNGKVIKPAETILESEAIAVIKPSIYERANAALKSHPKRGPSQNPPMLAKLKCNRCGSPMYRIKSGKRAKMFYRCFGSGPQRKGCGNMVPLEALDARIVAYSSGSTKPRTIREWIEGQTWDDQISNVKQDIREAVEAERFEVLPDLQAKLADLRSRDSVPGRWDFTETGITEGQHFNSLDNEGQREYLKTRDIRARKTANGGFVVTIDAQDGIVTDRTAVLYDSEKTMLAELARNTA